MRGMPKSYDINFKPELILLIRLHKFPTHARLGAILCRALSASIVAFGVVRALGETRYHTLRIFDVAPSARSRTHTYLPSQPPALSIEAGIFWRNVRAAAALAPPRLLLAYYHNVAIVLHDTSPTNCSLKCLTRATIPSQSGHRRMPLSSRGEHIIHSTGRDAYSVAVGSFPNPILTTDSQIRKQYSEYFDPCEEAAQKSIKCLHRNGGDREMCSDFFQYVYHRFIVV